MFSTYSWQCDNFFFLSLCLVVFNYFFFLFFSFRGHSKPKSPEFQIAAKPINEPRDRSSEREKGFMRRVEIVYFSNSNVNESNYASDLRLFFFLFFLRLILYAQVASACDFSVFIASIYADSWFMKYEYLKVIYLLLATVS